MLSHQMISLSIVKGMLLAQDKTYIRHIILIILIRSDLVGMLTSQQQGAAVERGGQTGDDSVSLVVGARGERACRAAEDISGCWPGEARILVVGEDVVSHFAGDVAEGGLRVDRERLGCVAGPDCGC